jgi:hypothetical protein
MFEGDPEKWRDHVETVAARPAENATAQARPKRGKRCSITYVRLSDDFALFEITGGAGVLPLTRTG